MDIYVPCLNWIGLRRAIVLVRSLLLLDLLFAGTDEQDIDEEDVRPEVMDFLPCLSSIVIHTMSSIA